MKKNNLMKTGITLALAGAMVVGAVAPVAAIVNETQQLTVEDNTAECEVVYELDSATTGWTVTIPKKITLEADKASDYTVNVNGDISSDKQISVVPRDMIADTADAIDFYMKDVSGAAKTKDDVVATVTQAETVWTWDEAVVDKAETGRIEAPGLTAGSWAGTFNFDIELGDLQ